MQHRVWTIGLLALGVLALAMFISGVGLRPTKSPSPEPTVAPPTAMRAAPVAPAATPAELLAKAERMRIAGEPGSTDVMKRAALQMVKSGDVAGGRAVLEAVVRFSTDPLDAGDACRLLAQGSLDAGDPENAERWLRKQIDLYDAHPDRQADAGASFASGVNQLVVLILMPQHRYEEALEINRRLVDATAPGIDRSCIEAAYTHQAMLLSRLGRAEEEARTYDRLLERYPDYGLADGAIVRATIRREELRDPAMTSTGAIARLNELWSNEAVRGHPAVLDAGERLGRSLRAAGDLEGVVRLGEEYLALIAARRAAWASHAKDPAELQTLQNDLEDRERSMLSRLSGAAAWGRADVALRVARRLIELARNDGELEGARLIEREALQALAK